MLDALLEVSVVDGWFPIALSVLAVLLLLYLLGRDRTGGWVMTAIIILIVGGLIGGAALWLCANFLDLFGGPVADAAWLWVPLASGAILLAIWNLWRSRWWRKLIAILAIPVFAVTAAVGVNAAYGIDTTIGAMLGISTADPIDIPDPDPAETNDPAEPLYATWKPPADLPAHGETGLVPGGIPNTNSGFDARPAQLYLPPAALVADAPRLPLVIMMMGQPGDPDPQFIAKVLDEHAAAHDGLAPIALVVDQLGDPTADPMCLDTDLGKVESYVMQDVVPWAREHLDVLRSAASWTVAGYSNGGGCAAYFGAKYPEVFGNILAVSPVEYAGAEHPQDTLRDVFGGDQAAYDAVKPANIMAAKAPYPDSTAVFTAGENDPAYVASATALTDAATAAGMAASRFLVPGADHGVSALLGGLDHGFDVLYARLGLVAP